jgi:hypothetical protein
MYFWLVGQWDTKRRMDQFLSGKTVRHKKKHGLIFGWWDSETQKGEWINFCLVGQWDTKRRVDKFWAGGTVRHKKSNWVYFWLVGQKDTQFWAIGTVKHRTGGGNIFFTDLVRHLDCCTCCCHGFLPPSLCNCSLILRCCHGFFPPVPLQNVWYWPNRDLIKTKKVWYRRNRDLICTLQMAVCYWQIGTTG